MFLLILIQTDTLPFCIGNREVMFILSDDNLSVNIHPICSVQFKKNLLIIFHIVPDIFAPLLNNRMTFRFQHFFLRFDASGILNSYLTSIHRKSAFKDKIYYNIFTHRKSNKHILQHKFFQIFQFITLPLVKGDEGVEA